MAMRTRLKVLLALGSILLMVPSTASAVGYGMNFTYGHRMGDLSDVDDFINDLEWTSNDFAFGFTLDTAVAKDKVFNYRMNLNYERGIIDLKIAGLGSADDQKSNGMAMDHIFAFGVVRNDNMRLWVGPAIRLSVSGIDQSGYNGIEADFGFGAIAGVNIHMSDLISAGLTFGYTYNGAIAGTDTVGIDTAFTGGLHRISAGVVVLFRGRGDQYSPRP